MPGLFGVAVEAIIEKEGKIFIGKRAEGREHMPGIWECLSGRVEQGETAEEAVVREVKEETTLAVTVVEPFNTFRFIRETGKQEYQGISFWCKYKSGEVTIDPCEHSEYKWVTPREALNYIKLPNITASINRFIDRLGKLP